MADQSPTDLVEIRHPDLPASNPAVTTRAAFEQLWQAKGFELVATPADAVDPTELKGAALEQALKDAGLPSTGSADDKRAALAAHSVEG